MFQFGVAIFESIFTYGFDIVETRCSRQIVVPTECVLAYRYNAGRALDELDRGLTHIGPAECIIAYRSNAVPDIDILDLPPP